MARFRDALRLSVNNMASVVCRFVSNWGQNNRAFEEAFLASVQLSDWIQGRQAKNGSQLPIAPAMVFYR